MAEAHAPDADRAVPNAPAQIPGWLVHLLALLLLLAQAGLSPVPAVTFLPSRQGSTTGRTCRSPRRRLCRIDPRCQAIAIARMCLRRGFGPGHRDRPEMSRAIVAFRGSAEGSAPAFRSAACNGGKEREIVPGMIGMARAAPPPTRWQRCLRGTMILTNRRQALTVVPAATQPAVAPAPTRPECALDSVRRPDRLHTRINNSIRSSQRDRAMAGPALLIRAAAMPRSRAPIPPKQSCLLPPARVMCLGAKKVSSRTSSG